jgi:hypothetical protein
LVSASDEVSRTSNSAICQWKNVNDTILWRSENHASVL